MKRLFLALALVLSGAAAEAQIVTPPTFDGGSVTNPFLAPSGCATPGFSFTGDPDAGLCTHTEPSWATDATALAVNGNPIAEVFTASGGEWFFEVNNPNFTNTRMFRLRGDTDLTRFELYAPEDGAGTVQYLLQNAQSYYLHGASTNGTPPVHEIRADDGTVPTLRLGEQLEYLNIQPTVDMASIKTATFPDATGTVEIQQSSEPTCDATTRGQIAFVQGGAGVADTYRICGKSAADTYAWQTIATF
jgi:hypothetical protein